MAEYTFDYDFLPIQKCLSGYDPRMLSDIELLSVIIGSGTQAKPVIELAAHIYQRFGGFKGVYKSGLSELSSVNGIGKIKAVKIIAALESGKRIINGNYPDELCDSPIKAWRLIQPQMICLKQEEFFVISLNTANKVIKISRISVGTISEAIVHPREVFREAIKESASSVILAHNHPSGNITPSSEDKETTKRLEKVGSIIGIMLVDHIIVSDTGYFSFKEDGLL